MLSQQEDQTSLHGWPPARPWLKFFIRKPSCQADEQALASAWAARLPSLMDGPLPFGDLLGIGVLVGVMSIPSSDESLYNYRGVQAGHPRLGYAEQGIVYPGDPLGDVTPEAHNEGRVASSPYTFWTTKEGYAIEMANRHGPGGVVLRVPQAAPPAGATWRWEFSPDSFGESEILMKGVRHGAEVWRRY
ncbi:MAG: hypothetical protein K0U74_13125 [Alphaproteobacteria bacterium]|nr:hypothetical protein [Alphaproteobacteria bacterium]